MSDARGEPLSAAQTLEQEFLEIRAKILEVGAAFDRIERGVGDLAADPRLEKLRRCLTILLENSGNRAEQIQLVFSRPYSAKWPNELSVPLHKFR